VSGDERTRVKKKNSFKSKKKKKGMGDVGWKGSAQIQFEVFRKREKKAQLSSRGRGDTPLPTIVKNEANEWEGRRSTQTKRKKITRKISQQKNFS